MKKILLTALLAAVSYCGFSQEYLLSNFGKSNFGGTFIVKNQKKYWGFGISFFNNEIRKGRNFYDGSSAEIIKTELFPDGVLFGVYGREISNFLFDVKLGFGSRKFYNLGSTNATEWYSFRDGGSYLVYGANFRREFRPVVVGIGYDNFSGLNFSIGFRIFR